MILLDNKDETVENIKKISMFNIQTEIPFYKGSIEDITKYYNEISNIYFKIISIYPEFTDLLNELLGITKETNEIVRLKEKYEKLLTLPIFKNNHVNRWKMW